MFGESVDTLNMYMENTYESRVLIWSLSGHQINKWQPASYTIQFFSPVRLWLEGTAGAGYSGDIALDDFVLNYGECKADVSLSYFYQIALSANWDYILYQSIAHLLPL